MSNGNSAGAEWRAYPMLPIAAALGYATSVIHIYGFSPFVIPITETFGWTRTQATFGLTIATLVQAIFSIPIGLAVDRFGPRIMALYGMVMTCGAFALLGTADGTSNGWYLLWGVMAVATLPVQASIWTSAVASRFAVSRGFAFAVTLCGASVAITIFPYFGARLIAAYGWRQAFSIEAATWATIAIPMIFLFFRGAYDKGRDGAKVAAMDKSQIAGVSLSEGLFNSIYIRLMIASLFFTFTIVALSFHFTAILKGQGVDTLKAAGIAGLIGIFSIIGRLSTGMLLDRFRGSLVGAVAFLLPAMGCLVLLGAGQSTAGQMASAALIGLTLGAEIDVIVYLTTRYFGLKNFGGLYGGLLMALSIGTATGPLAAAKVYDVYGNYTPFLWLTIGFMAVSSALLASLPQAPTWSEK